MTEHHDLTALAETGQAAPANIGILVGGQPAAPTRMNRGELLLSVAEMFRARGHDVFDAVFDIERVPFDETEAKLAAGTVFEPVVAHLRNLGIEQDGTIGGVVNVLGLDRDQAHYFACFCHSERIAGHEAADRIQHIAHGGSCEDEQLTW